MEKQDISKMALAEQVAYAKQMWAVLLMRAQILDKAHIPHPDVSYLKTHVDHPEEADKNYGFHVIIDHLEMRLSQLAQLIKGHKL